MQNPKTQGRRTMLNELRTFCAARRRALPLILTACLLISQGAAWGQTAPPAPGPFPIEEMRDSFYDAVRQRATEVSRGGTGAADALKYSSTREEQNIVFEDEIAINAPDEKLAILSDDGCDVEIWALEGPDARIYKPLARNGVGQSLPNLSESLHRVPFDFAKYRSVPSSTTPQLISRYKVRITYSNTSYKGTSDIDGVTLFLYKGYSDTTAPSVAITQPVGSRSYTYQNLTRISGTASDTGDSGLNRVRVLLYRQASSRAPAGYYAGGSNWNGNDQTYRAATLNSNGTWNQDLPSIAQGFVPGTYVARAIAVDNAENRSQPVGVVFTMLAPPDTTPPSVSITTPVSGRTYRGLSAAGGTVSDGASGSGIRSVAVLLHRNSSNGGYFNGSGFVNDTSENSGRYYRAATVQEGRWTFTLPTSQQGFTSGNYTVKVLAKDNAENINTAVAGFDLESSPAEVRLQWAAQWVNNPGQWVQHCNAENSDNTDCGNFVADVLQASGSDPNFPEQGTSIQYNYIVNSDAWIHGSMANAVPQPGDVLIITGPQRGTRYGHIAIYVGVVNGQYQTYEGSLGNHPPELISRSLEDLRGTFSTWARPEGG